MKTKNKDSRPSDLRRDPSEGGYYPRYHHFMCNHQTIAGVCECNFGFLINVNSTPHTCSLYCQFQQERLKWDVDRVGE